MQMAAAWYEIGRNQFSKILISMEQPRHRRGCSIGSNSLAQCAQYRHRHPLSQQILI